MGRSSISYKTLYEKTLKELKELRKSYSELINKNITLSEKNIEILLKINDFEKCKRILENSKTGGELATLENMMMNHFKEWETEEKLKEFMKYNDYETIGQALWYSINTIELMYSDSLGFMEKFYKGLKKEFEIVN